MAEPIYIMQNSFTGGEFSPVMDARQDLQKYATGLKTMRNFYALPHGAAMNRPGTYYVADAINHDKRSRLIPFRFSEEQAYPIEFGEGYCHFFYDGAQILYEVGHPQEGDPVQVATPYQEADLREIDYTQSADVLYLAHGKYKPKMLSRLGQTNWTLTDYPFHDGPFMPINLDAAKTIAPSAVTGSIDLTASAAIFNAGHIGALWKLIHMVEDQSISETLSALGNTASLKGKGQWAITTHNIWTGKLQLKKSEDGGATWTILRTYVSVADSNVIESGNEDDICLLRLELVDYTSGSVRIDLHWFPYDVLGIVEITAVTDATHATATVKRELGAAAVTDVWAEGSWSDYRGWPSTVVFYQNRIEFGNTKSEPQTPWGSKVGDYPNFGVTYPVVKDDDAITTPLVSQQLNAVRSMVALSKIIALTSGGHWTVGPAGDNSSFTPSSQSAVQHGYYGASKLKPLVVGNRILYAQDKGTIIRDIGYDLTSDSFEDSDPLTLLAEHLFRKRKIVEWAYQQEPSSIVWCVRDDGVLLGFTYLRKQEVWGWHRHDTEGIFESVCTIPGEDRDEVWFVVKRTINGQTRRYVEQMASRETEVYTEIDEDGEMYSYQDTAEQYFVDCGLSYDGEPASTFSGLDHLEGKTVSILADGNVHPRKVVTDGAVTIDRTVRKAHIGLPYTCDLQTLNVDFPTKQGTIQTRNKRIVKATLRLEATRGAMIGATFKKMYELKMRTVETAGEPIKIYSGDKDMPLNSNSNREGRVCVRMTDPLPVTVLAIVMELTLDG